MDLSTFNHIRATLSRCMSVMTRHAFAGKAPRLISLILLKMYLTKRYKNRRCDALLAHLALNLRWANAPTHRRYAYSPLAPNTAHAAEALALVLF